MRIVSPGPADHVLDVGVAGPAAGTGNHFEQVYPWPEQLTACGIEGRPDVCRRRAIRFVPADGRRLPFDQDSFDIVFCSAVIEHTGARPDQRRLVSELVRVARRVWLATPDRDSPVEPHTLLPMVHWLPERLRGAAYRATGRGYFADKTHLNPLDAGQLRGAFPQAVRGKVAILRQYVMGMPLIMVAYLDRRA